MIEFECIISSYLFLGIFLSLSLLFSQTLFNLHFIFHLFSHFYSSLIFLSIQLSFYLLVRKPFNILKDTNASEKYRRRSKWKWKNLVLLWSLWSQCWEPKLRPIDPFLLTLILYPYTHRRISLNIKAGSHTNGPLLLLHFFSDHFTPSPPLYIRAFLVPSLSHMHSLSLCSSFIFKFDIWHHHGKRWKTNEAKISAEEMELIRQWQQA